METMEQDNGEIGKELDKMNPENLPEYIHTLIQQKEIQETTREI